MEHRCSARVPARVNVLVYRHGLPVMRGHTRDLSSEGMFVEMRSATLSRNEYLEIEFSVDPSSGRRWRVPALVAHTTAHGAGFYLPNTDPGVREALGALLLEYSHLDSIGAVGAA